jgi:tartrate dehydrogenase/decarboxylase/D-malate dehydrogenase
MVRTHKIAVIPGDGIGIETVSATLKVLDKLVELDGGFKLDYTHFDYGSEHDFQREDATN